MVDAAKIHFLNLAKIWLTKGRHYDRGRAYKGHFSVPEGHNSKPVTRAAETALLAGVAPVLLRAGGVQNIQIRVTVETPQLGNYHHTHLIAIIDSVRDKIIVKGLLKETKLNEHREALARANADIATVPTHVRVFTISLKRSTQNLQLSTTWAGRLHHLFGVDRKWHFGAVRTVLTQNRQTECPTSDLSRDNRK